MGSLLAEGSDVTGLLDEWSKAIGYNEGAAKEKFNLFKQVLGATVNRQVVLPTSPDQGGPHCATFQGIPSGLPDHGSVMALAHLVLLAMETPKVTFLSLLSYL